MIFFLFLDFFREHLLTFSLRNADLGHKPSQEYSWKNTRVPYDLFGNGASFCSGGASSNLAHSSNCPKCLLVFLWLLTLMFVYCAFIYIGRDPIHFFSKFQQITNVY